MRFLFPKPEALCVFLHAGPVFCRAHAESAGALSTGVFAESGVPRRVGSSCGTPLPATALWAAFVRLSAVWGGIWCTRMPRTAGQGSRMARNIIMFDFMSAFLGARRMVWQEYDL